MKRNGETDSSNWSGGWGGWVGGVEGGGEGGRRRKIRELWAMLSCFPNVNTWMEMVYVNEGRNVYGKRKSLCRIPLCRAVSKQPLMPQSLLVEEEPHGVTDSSKVVLCCLWNVLFCFIRCSLRGSVWTTRMGMTGRAVYFFRRLRKIAKSDHPLCHARLSDNMELCCQCTDFYKI
jgi:hypothetical protein